MQVSFQANIPPYKIAKAKIYPIEQNITPSDCNFICNEVNKHGKCIGEGVNGSAYHLGRDLVVKTAKTNALVKSNIMNEARKLDMLRELPAQISGNSGLENTQRGIAAFQLNNGQAYLISSLVKGVPANAFNNALNSKNLQSLIYILTELDKGTEKYGRMMVYDLNTNNINFTRSKAGVLDFEHLSGSKIDANIKSLIVDNISYSSPHISDTSYLGSNIRSFEFAALYDYLCETDNPKKFLNTYLNQKSIYHQNMSRHLLEQCQESMYPDIMKEIAQAEMAHSRLLSGKKLPEDIIKSEALKIQMSHFMFISSSSCNAPECLFNPRQIYDYGKKGLQYFETNLEKALHNQDSDRIIYYKDCIKIFDKWTKKAELLPKTMKPSQRNRIAVGRDKTLDQLL